MQSSHMTSRVVSELFYSVQTTFRQALSIPLESAPPTPHLRDDEGGDFTS
jgi:hypothetical protein